MPCEGVVKFYIEREIVMRRYGARYACYGNPVESCVKNKGRVPCFFCLIRFGRDGAGV